MQANTAYENAVEEVRDYLPERAAATRCAGVKQENIRIDPGIVLVWIGTGHP
jgi:dihydropteroate synthase